jgi:hypothetical protein
MGIHLESGFLEDRKGYWGDKLRKWEVNSSGSCEAIGLGTSGVKYSGVVVIYSVLDFERGQDI